MQLIWGFLLGFGSGGRFRDFFLELFPFPSEDGAGVAKSRDDEFGGGELYAQFLRGNGDGVILEFDHIDEGHSQLSGERGTCASMVS